MSDPLVCDHCGEPLEDGNHTGNLCDECFDYAHPPWEHEPT